MNKQGKTTGNLKMRSGPGMQFEPPIAYLVPDTALEILGEEGDWWKVRAQGKEGYVGKKYVAVTEAPPEPAASAKTARPVRPGIKPAAPKGIQADASAVDPTVHKPTLSKPSAPKSGATKPNAPKPNVTKPNIPRPTGPKKR